jgi:hypothetical protein
MHQTHPSTTSTCCELSLAVRHQQLLPLPHRHFNCYRFCNWCFDTAILSILHAAAPQHHVNLLSNVFADPYPPHILIDVTAATAAIVAAPAGAEAAIASHVAAAVAR